LLFPKTRALNSLRVLDNALVLVVVIVIIFDYLRRNKRARFEKKRFFHARHLII